MPTTRNHNYGTYVAGNILSSFQFDLVDDDTIVKTLLPIKLKSSSGHDGISTKLLKFLSPPLISPLHVIINQSLITGIYPDKLKIAKVIPLFKKDDKAKTDNYRPFSLLSSISKIFEKVVYNQLYKYYTQNKSQIARFMGPTWGPPGSCRPQMGPTLAPWTLLSGIVLWESICF